MAYLGKKYKAKYNFFIMHSRARPGSICKEVMKSLELRKEHAHTAQIMNFSDKQ